MTNGEKIKEIFPNMKITVCEFYVRVMGENNEFNKTYPLKWWNAEYKELSNSTSSDTKTETLVSLDVYKQVAKERDIAIEQLHELGYEFGQKIEPKTKDCLAVEWIVDEVIKKVMPIKPKGHWILTDVEGDRIWHCNCSECGKDPQDYIGGSEDWWLIKNKLPKFCPSCGSDNSEVEG